MHEPDHVEDLTNPCGLVVRGLREDDAFLLSLYGELDLSTARVLERKLQMAEAVQSEKLVIDLSGLQFMDSSGLHTLMKAQGRWCAGGRELTLLRGPRAVQRVFELTNSAELFSFED